MLESVRERTCVLFVQVACRPVGAHIVICFAACCCIYFVHTVLLSDLLHSHMQSTLV